MPLAPVHPLPSPKAVYGLCERFGDQSRLAALKRLVVEEPASEGRGRALGRGTSAAPGGIAGSLAPVDDPPPPSASAAPSAPSAPSEKKVHGPLVLVQPQNNDRTTKPDPKSADYKEASEALQNQLKAFTALDVTALPPVIQRTLAWMVAQKDAACKKNAAIAPSAEMGSELRLLRFLIGQKWDPYKASEEYLKVCNERKKLGVDSMRNQMVAENEAFFNGSSDSLQQIYFHSQAKRSAALMPRLWVDTREEGNYMLLRDKANHLVIAEYAPDFDKVSELGPDNYNATELAFNELQVLVLDTLSARDGILRMACRVQDTFGQENALGQSMMPNPFAGKGEKAFKATGAMMKMLYPTVVFKWFMVNIGPAVKGTVQTAIANFGGRSAYKMIVCGSDYAEQVLASIDASQLPEQLSGTLPKALFAKDV